MKRLWARILEGGWLRWLLMAQDVVLSILAFFTAWYARYELNIGGLVEPRNDAPFSAYLPIVLVLTILLLINLRLEGLYRRQRGATFFDELYGIINATTTSIILIVFFFFFYRPTAYSRLIFAYAAALIILYLSLSRLLLRWWTRQLQAEGIGVTRVLIVGGGEGGRTLLRHIVAQPDLGYEVVGFVDDDPNQQDIGRFRLLGHTDQIPALVKEHQVDRVIITLPWQYQRKILQILEHCERQAVQSRIVPDMFQLSLTRVTLDEIKGVPLIAMKEPVLKGANLAFKRLTDVAIAGGVLLLSSPILLLVALAIRLDSPGPILYKQLRVGRGGKLFTIYKFRSMRIGAEEEVEKLQEMNEADGPLFKIRNDPRVTRVGRFIRKWSLDEFPQLFNVLRGDMSLIGPRPALPNEVAQYQDWHYKRLEAAPGLTGLWQVSGRSDVTFDEMMLLDIYYTEQWSPLLDTIILLKTIPTVLFQRGAY